MLILSRIFNVLPECIEPVEQLLLTDWLDTLSAMSECEGLSCFVQGQQIQLLCYWQSVSAAQNALQSAEVAVLLRRIQPYVWGDHPWLPLQLAGGFAKAAMVQQLQQTHLLL